MQSQGLSFRAFQDADKNLSDSVDEQNWERVIQICLADLKKEGLPYLIYLHAYHFLEDIFSGIVKSKNIWKNAELLYLVPKKMCDFFFEGLLTKQDRCYKNAMEFQADQRYSNKIKQEGECQFNVVECQKNKEIKLILKELAENKNKNRNLKGRQFPNVIKRVMEFQIEENVYQQICMNWVRKSLDEIRDMEDKICCKCFFERGKELTAVEDKHQEFKKYSWPIKATNIMNHVKKTIVGFLNMYGGIIYIGIQEDKEKINTVVGVTLNRSKQKDVFQFFRDLVDEIYPKHQYFQVRKDINYPRYDGCSLKINDYVSMEFQPVVEERHLYNYRTDKDTEKVYIIKIVVKIGHPKHLYHVINSERGTDFFLRQDRNVEKKAFHEAHMMIYDRLAKFHTHVETKTLLQQQYDRMPFCINCQYNMDFKLEQEDEAFSSDDDQ